MSVELLPMPVFAFFAREENDGASSYIRKRKR